METIVYIFLGKSNEKIYKNEVLYIFRPLFEHLRYNCLSKNGLR